MTMTVMVYRPARLTGAPIMECPDCGAVCAYWDADDMTPNPVTGALELHCADYRHHYGTCVHCAREIHLVDGAWIDPAATGDDAVWRETCDSHDTFTAEHEPAGPHRCAHGRSAVVQCGGCGMSWCEDCDPAPAALCHYCHGRGYSHAPRDGGA